jgi:hypothetical protein
MRSRHIEVSITYAFANRSEKDGLVVPSPEGCLWRRCS